MSRTNLVILYMCIHKNTHTKKDYLSRQVINPQGLTNLVSHCEVLVRPFFRILPQFSLFHPRPKEGGGGILLLLSIKIGSKKQRLLY